MVSRLGVGSTSLVSQKYIQMTMVVLLLCWKNVYLVSERQTTLDVLVSFFMEGLPAPAVGDAVNRLPLTFGPVRDHGVAHDCLV